MDSRELNAGNKVLYAYLVLRSHIQQVESPDVRRDTRVGCIITKHP